MLADRAVIFVDGRYVLQVRDQVDTNVFAVEHLVDNPPEKWLETNLAAGARLPMTRGCIPPTRPEILQGGDGGRRDAGAVESNPLDAVWPTALPHRSVRSRCGS